MRVLVIQLSIFQPVLCLTQGIKIPVVQAWGEDMVWDVGNCSRKVLMSMSFEHYLRVVGRNLCLASFKTMDDKIQAFYKNGGWRWWGGC